MNPSARKRAADLQSEQGQPPEWEALLSNVSHSRDYHESSWDPAILSLMIEQSGFSQVNEQRIDEVAPPEIDRQLDAIRRLARRKLRGITQQCILLVLATGAGPGRIAKWLRVSEDTVRRSIERGVQTLRECLEPLEYGEFPAGKGRRPTVRAAVFALDSADERERFQAFLNERTVVHLSYRGDDIFREVMAVYLTGKPGSAHSHAD